MTASPWRNAICAGLLAAGVMIGGAPMVHADSDSGASDGSSGHATEKPRTLHDVSAKLGMGQHKSASSPTGPTDSIRSAGATLTRSIVGAARVARTATLPTSGRQQQAAAGAPPSPTVAALPLSSVVRQVTEPLTKAVPSAGGEVVPASIAGVTTTVTTVQSLATDAVVTVIPELAAPIAAVAPLLQLPAHFVSQFGNSPTQSVGGGVATTSRSAGDESVAQLLQIIATPSGPPGAAPPVAVGVPAPPPITPSAFDLTAALGHLPSASTAAPVGPDNAGPDGVSTFLKTYGGLVAASLAALLAAAIPGLAGMFIPTAAGAHLGYRQAKARMAMRTLRTARFSAMEPIGIVRSGGLVTLRPKPTQVVRARAADLTRDAA